MPFSNATFKTIDTLLSNAHAEGRTTLFEHEIYDILNHIGLQTPNYVFIRSPDDVTGDLLKQFNHHIILKIVSPDIAHKQKIGGVRKVRNHDALFVQFALNKMREEVLAHFSAEPPPEISGFLLVEFIPHTQALGYEVLLGFSEDPAFGPVMTLSKGGEDAEFFARYYDPPNLFLPPLSRDQVKKIVYSLNIRHKFEQAGQLHHLEQMTEAASLMARLAWHYSFAAERSPRFIIKTLDVNPFVISEDGRFVAVDGFADFAPYSPETIQVPPVRLNHLDAFFYPRGIGVIGVSANPERHSLARNIAHLLHDMGRDDLYFINPRGGNIRFGETDYPLYADVNALPEPVDLIVYSAPARSVTQFFKTLSPKRHPKAVILISGIPSNLNYTDFTREVDKVRPENIRVIGPNCMGVFFAPDASGKGLNTLFLEEERLDIKASPFSNTVLLTQSGAFSVTAIDRLQKSRLFQSVVSFGNKYDVKITDLMAWFADMPRIDLIALYVEGLDPGEGRRFFELAQNLSKPVIVYKAGKTDAGARVAASHTASMSGSYDVFKAACKQAGVILAETTEEHYDYVKIFSLTAHRPPQGSRLAGVVNAGFESAAGADEMIHLTQARLSQETIDALSRIDATGLVDIATSFLDITPMADDRMYADFVEAVLQDDGVDCVFVSVVPHTQTLKTSPEDSRDPDGLARRLVALHCQYEKPMVISVNAGRYYQEFVAVLEENGLPVYGDVRSAIRALDCLCAYYLNLHHA